MVQQLTLNIEKSYVAADAHSAYQRLIARPCTWKEIYGAAKAIEVQVPKMGNREQYSHLGVTPKEFWVSIEPVRDEYIIATKIIWWQKLVIKADCDETWLTKDDMLNNRFFCHFNFFRFNARKKFFNVVVAQLNRAKLHWHLAKQKYGLSTTFKEDLHRYVGETLRGLQEDKIAFFENHLIRLQKENEALTKGNLTYFGKECSNRDISGKYHEIYIMACHSSMNTVQFKHFCDILILQDFYRACAYLDKFEVYL